MPARAFRCTNPTCTKTLGTISRKRDQHGTPYDKLKLNSNVEHVGRILFRGKYAECQCGERVAISDGVTVEFH